MFAMQQAAAESTSRKRFGRDIVLTRTCMPNPLLIFVNEPIEVYLRYSPLSKLLQHSKVRHFLRAGTVV